MELSLCSNSTALSYKDLGEIDGGVQCANLTAAASLLCRWCCRNSLPCSGYCHYLFRWRLWNCSCTRKLI